jgi:hypothetical protein
MAPGTDDELPIEGAGHRRESGATLGTQPGPSRTVRFEAKDQGVGRKPVAPLKHQLSPWSHRLHPKAGHRRALHQRARSRRGAIGAADELTSREAMPREKDLSNSPRSTGQTSSMPAVMVVACSSMYGKSVTSTDSPPEDELSGELNSSVPLTSPTIGGTRRLQRSRAALSRE